MSTSTTVLFKLFFIEGMEKDANYQIDAKDFKGPLDQQNHRRLQICRKIQSGIGAQRHWQN